MHKQIWAFLGMLVLAMTLLVACGGNDDEPAFGEFAAVSQDSGADRDDSFLTGGDGDSGGGSASVRGVSAEPGSPLPGNTGPFDQSRSPNATGDDSKEGGNAGLDPVSLQISDGRIIIYTSSMVVIVDDVPLATQQAPAAIAGLGGLVFGQDTVTEPRARTVLTFKVLPEDFDEALDRLAELGKLESQRVSTDDVTERVVDLESRITTSAASVERLRTFLGQATTLEGVAQIEFQLLQRETDLERLRGQLRTLEGQAALATIFLTLTEPEPDEREAMVELVETAYLGHNDGDRCPGDDELSVTENEAITICFEIENTGNLALTEIEVRDVGLDLDDDDFIVLEGSLDGPLEPGEVLIGYFELDAELHGFASPRFSAVPVDEDGDKVRLGIGVDADVVELDVTEDDSVTSFSDGLSDSFGALATAGQLAVLGVAVAIPFLWVPLLLLALVWVIRRMMLSRTRTAPVAATSTPTESESDD